MSRATFTRPSRGDVLELTIDSLAHGGNGVARREGYVVFVAGARARRPRAGGGRQGQEGVRGGARGRDRRAVAGPRPRVRRPSGRAVAGAALRAPARGQGRRRSTRRCARIGRLDGLRARADRARRRAVALPQQGRVLVRHRAPRASSCAASTRPAAGTRSSRWPTASSSRERVERAARAGARVLHRATARGTGATSAASCATSSSARAAAPARRRSGWSPRRASSTSTA